jgi:hypothetical protein
MYTQYCDQQAEHYVYEKEYHRTYAPLGRPKRQRALLVSIEETLESAHPLMQTEYALDKERPQRRIIRG